MASRKAFLLRIDPAVLEALQRWANDDLRSLNGQIEFVLRRALAAAARSISSGESGPSSAAPTSHGPRASDRADPPPDERPARKPSR